MRDRGQSMREIARMAGIGEKLVRELIERRGGDCGRRAGAGGERAARRAGERQRRGRRGGGDEYPRQRITGVAVSGTTGAARLAGLSVGSARMEPGAHRGARARRVLAVGLKWAVPGCRNHYG